MHDAADFRVITPAGKKERKNERTNERTKERKNNTKTHF